MTELIYFYKGEISHSLSKVSANLILIEVFTKSPEQNANRRFLCSIKVKLELTDGCQVFPAQIIRC